MPNRRDFLKYFGIGTIIAPIANGEVLTSLPARLIEVPNVAEVELAHVLPDFNYFQGLQQLFIDRSRTKLTVIVETDAPKTRQVFISDTYIDRVDIAMTDSPTWTIDGRFRSSHTHTKL